MATINLSNEEFNERMRVAREQMLAEMSEEEKQAYLAMEKARDNYMIIKLSKKYNVNIELIDGDNDHIMLNGQRMGHAEFDEWLMSQNQDEDEEEEEEENEYGISAYLE